jgi:hypothetical protein
VSNANKDPWRSELADPKDRRPGNRHIAASRELACSATVVLLTPAASPLPVAVFSVAAPFEPADQFLQQLAQCGTSLPARYGAVTEASDADIS